MGCDTQEVNVGRDMRPKRHKSTGGGKKKFRVHFAQVNQTYRDVFADDPEDAVGVATRKWRQDNWPHVDEVREL